VRRPGAADHAAFQGQALGEFVVGGRHLRRKKRTTVPDPVAPLVPDLLRRDFTASRLDERWCGGITSRRSAKPLIPG
jgi:hypothetical protein